MCYSIASMKSYKELDDWLDRIGLNELADALPIALIATQSDREDQRVITKR